MGGRNRQRSKLRKKKSEVILTRCLEAQPEGLTDVSKVGQTIQCQIFLKHFKVNELKTALRAVKPFVSSWHHSQVVHASEFPFAVVTPNVFSCSAPACGFFHIFC